MRASLIVMVLASVLSVGLGCTAEPEGAAKARLDAISTELAAALSPVRDYGQAYAALQTADAGLADLVQRWPDTKVARHLQQGRLEVAGLGPDDMAQLRMVLRDLAFAEDDPLSLAWVLVMSLDDPVLRLHGLNQLAQRLTALDRDEEALGVLDEALMLAEDSRMADFALAELSVQLAGQGLFADADKVLGYVQDEEHRLAAAIQVLPAYARNDAVTARTRMHAIQTLVDAIDAPLAKARLLARLGETWAEMRDPMLADLLFVKAERIFQDAPMNEMRGLAEDALAGSLSRSCRNDRALALLDHPGVAPNAAYIQNRVAECLAGSGETIAAAAALRRINAYGIGTDPDPVNRGFALADSARVRARMGDSASALSLFGSAVALSVQTQDPVRQQLLHQFIALELGAADLDPSVDRRRLLTGMLYHHYPPAEFR